MRTALALAATIALTGCAHAWEPTEFYQVDKSVRHPQVKAWRKVHKPKGPPVHVVIRLPKPEEERCKPVMDALGDEARSEAAAKLEAQKSIKQAIRFKHGERFLDLANARDGVRYKCAPSSVPALGGKVEEFAGRFLPIEKVRCQIFVIPCEAPTQIDGDGK